MPLVLHDPPFERWVRHFFDHPVTSPAWHWDLEAEAADVNPALVVAHVTRLFEESGVLLSAYSDAQVNQGLWFLASSSDSLHALRDTNVQLQERVTCIRAISRLYEQVFVHRCTPHLSHIDEAGAGSLNSICYMWWDILPLYGKPEDPERREIDEACLAVLEEVLALPTMASQESALHGLGHWALYYPQRCSSVVDGFLASHSRLPPELAEYAKCARGGMVQ